ncbi:MFS transporter [Microbacterium paraoxydans]|jgi:MFS family permease|uniref:MFS transporter n=1 Tax=Microbacterium TaxID=33882 RepID=UPI000D01B768|nr:MFS transporter [Microbacterium sp. str. 'China']AVL98299.1 MFS transporter [Microbacterium sp. str. 'China']
MSASDVTVKEVRSLVPARMDRLPWSRFHWMIVVGLGFSWILDGLEVQIVAANGYAQTLGMGPAEVGLAGTCYLLGQVFGALVFGRLADRLGRKNLFLLSLGVYLVGSAVAGLAFAPWFFYIWRFVAGAGIGGEYAAINSAIDEIIPAKYRGRVDIAINGTYWGGAALGAVANMFFLNTDILPADIGWRLSFFVGPILGLLIIWLRRHIPESPRWQMTHGREEEAERNVDEIEERIRKEGKTIEPVDESKAITVKEYGSVPFLVIAKVLFKKYPRRTLVGITMMVTQSFLYNAIFFTYALVLENFYDTPPASASQYFIVFAVGNLAGALILGHFFDTWGRRRMLFGTYVLAGLILLVSAFLFNAGVLNAGTHTAFWCASFFFASAGASAAYLTVSEIFPLELRSQVISYVFSIGQLVGAIAPVLYGALIGASAESGDRGPLFWGYVLGAAIMMFGGVVCGVFGVSAAGKSLEDIADPLSLVVPAKKGVTPGAESGS